MSLNPVNLQLHDRQIANELNCFNDVIFGYLVTKHNPPKGGKIFTRSGDLEVIGSRFVRIKLII
jgi:hypothetical protein